MPIKKFIIQSFHLDAVRTIVYDKAVGLERKVTDEIQKSKWLRTNKGTDLESKTDVGAITTQVADLDANMSTAANGKPIISMLGTPVFCDLILTSQTLKKSVQLLWVIAEVTQEKIVVRTQIQGRKGTVKEYISDGDFSVRLRGGFDSEFSDAYPKQQVADLIQLLKQPESLQVTSEFLKQFGIYELVVMSYSFPQVEGHQSRQLFDISCYSDEPIQLQTFLFPVQQ